MGHGVVPTEAKLINNVDVFEEEQRSAFATVLHGFSQSLALPLAAKKIVSGSSEGAWDR